MVILLISFMCFVGMTYEFILLLLEKRSMKEWLPSSNSNSRWPDDPPPPEPANVPKPPTDPDDVLQAANEIEGVEEVENEDGNVTIEYTYSPNGYIQRLDGVQGLDWVQWHSDMKNKEKE